MSAPTAERRPASAPMRTGVMAEADLIDWLRGVRRMLIDFREEHHEPAWWQMIREKLIEDDFTYEQSLLAEAYLFKGNRYGRKHTIYADFWPSREQAEAANIDVIPRAMHERIVRELRTKLTTEIEIEVRQRLTRSVNPERSAVLEAMKAEYDLRVARHDLAEARSDLASTRDKLKSAENTIIQLKHQIRELRHDHPASDHYATDDPTDDDDQSDTAREGTDGHHPLGDEQDAQQGHQ